MYRFFRIGALLVVIGTPLFAFADVNADIAAQAAALQKQVQALEQQLGAGSGTSATTATTGTKTTTTASGTVIDSSACPNIGRSLRVGSTGDDVARLQAFLARDPSIYPNPIVSGYFGSLTQAAVQRWQVKYNIVSSGTPATTGYGMVGPRTAAAIALLCSTTSNKNTAGGYITVSPISGSAPLTVNVTANVNTTLSCSGSLYTLNYGDGSAPQAINVPPNNCAAVVQSLTHTYVYGGTYTIVLASGTHQTAATVTVAGPPAPTGTNGGTIATNGSTPKGTFSAFVTSGNAPLTTTFYVSCVGGTVYNVVFGDGTDLGSAGVGNTQCNGGLQSISHTYQTAGSYTAQLVIFAQQGNGTLYPMQFGTATITVNGSTSSSGSGSTSNYVYGAPTLVPNTSSALGVAVRFDLPTACTGFDVSWGDGSSDSIQNDGGSACGSASVVNTQTHTYSTTGAYTITLKRGPSLTQVNTIAVTITN